MLVAVVVVAVAAYVYTAHGRTAVCARARVYNNIFDVRGISFASDHRNIVDRPRILLVHGGGAATATAAAAATTTESGVICRACHLPSVQTRAARPAPHRVPYNRCNSAL